MNAIRSIISNHKDFFSDLDIHFAHFIARFSVNEDSDIFLGAALLSRTTGNGDICLDLESTADTILFDTQNGLDRLTCPPLARWREKLLSSPAVGKPGDPCPLILDDRNRLYLYRYWEYEKKLADSIGRRATGEMQNFNVQKLKQYLIKLFKAKDTQEIDWQKIAAVIAVLKRFSVITGGPGSGKTYTVARILVLLLACDLQEKAKIYLAAPTGKAAARLAESIKKAKHRLKCDDHIKDAIPNEAYTLHRLLKPVAGTPYFHRNADNPLSADVVVVDEASMVDLALMSKLVQAVKPAARLVLIGDKDQLASVEAGSVLGDICDRQVIHGFTKDFLKTIEQLTQTKLGEAVQYSKTPSGLQDCITILQKNYRFESDSGIGGLSRAVNRGDAEASLVFLKNSAEKSIAWHEIKSDANLFRDLSRLIINGYRKYLTINDPVLALEALSRFKILCALKIGPFGANSINSLAEVVLSEENLIIGHHLGSHPWYGGRPILITRNDYNLGLFNGDIGITLPDPNTSEDELYVYFPDGSGDVKRFPTYRIPEHETVYAMTVHKSQGSEFDHVALILPDKDYPLLTRELIYTGMTRARQRVSIWGTEPVLKIAISRKIERKSGLRDALWT
jgi:exodeoxyribonuclease V alpha subunit